jgi:heavy metal translocating P-type ATPase
MITGHLGDIKFYHDSSIRYARLIMAHKLINNERFVASVDLHIEDMTCASCVLRVEKALCAVPGVARAQVNLATQRATLTFAEQPADPAAIVTHAIAAASRAGYPATEITDDTQDDDSLVQQRAVEQQHLQTNLFISLGLTVPVFLLEMGSHASKQVHQLIHDTLGLQFSWTLQAVLTSLVMFGPGRVFFRKGLPALWHRVPDMNSLVALGAGSAWLYSLAALIAPNWLPENARFVYFEAAAVIITLIILGRWLEARAKGRTGDAVQHLIGLQPHTAHFVKGDNEIVEVAIEVIKPGDYLLVRPGERLPTDGVITQGTPYIDESMITGEPVASEKHPGDAVTGGTLNTTRSFTFQATHTGRNTVLAQIVRMVQTAQGAKLPIQAVVDQITAWFVPAILLCALSTFLIWYLIGPDPRFSHALISAVAVLIIACPCAMGLATPTSVMVGTGRAAQAGILFRHGDALQRLRDVTVIAFDKTGTLTAGKPQVTDLEIIDPTFSLETVLSWTAAMQSHSEHPIARAFVQAANERSLNIPLAQEFEAQTGAGAKALVAGRWVSAGTSQYMNEQGLETTGQQQQLTDWGLLAKTPILIAINDKIVAIAALSDPIKATAQRAIQSIKSAGIRTVMITGDHPLTARAVADSLGIDEVHAGVLPAGKVKCIQMMQTTGQVVAYVGDGINDAPALATADVGIAIGTGTDIAIESASVVLISDNLNGLINAITLSHATLKNIHQNLFWAFAYNVALVPIAAGVLYPTFGIQLSPAFAAAAMACSSVFVVANALRLKQLKLR